MEQKASALSVTTLIDKRALNYEIDVSFPVHKAPSGTCAC
jgi:hypothetical protein